MLAVTNFDITYGAALAPTGYHRVTTASGGSASILKEGSTQIYLWSEDGGTSTPISEVAVIYGEEPVPEGFEKCARNIAKGTDSTSYLCFQRGGDKDPLGEELCIAYGDENPGEEYEKLERSLIPEDAGTPVFLYFKRTKDAAQKWSARSLKKGDPLDVKDSTGTWRVATVAEIDEEQVVVHYKGWPSKWDDTLGLASTRLAPEGKHTSGQTEFGVRVQGQRWDITAEDVEKVIERVQVYVDGQLQEEDEGQFWEKDVPSFIEKCLTAQYDHRDAVPKVNKFFKKVLKAYAHKLKSNDQLTPHMMQTLSRLADCDTRCSWFYSKYGVSGGSYYGTKGSAYAKATAAQNQYHEEDVGEEEEEVDEGEQPMQYLKLPKVHTEVSKCYVSNMNYFGRCGGFEGMLSRMDPDREGGACALADLATFATILDVGAYLFTPQFAQTFFDDFQRLMFGRLERMSMDELKEVKDFGDSSDPVVSVLRSAEHLLPIVLKEFDVDEAIEGFEAVLAKKLLVCEVLNPRIKGAILLNELIEMTERREARTYSSYGNSGSSGYYYGGTNQYSSTSYGTSYGSNVRKPQAPVSRWLTTTWLTRWCEREEIALILLGDRPTLQKYKLEDTHLEILKRAEKVLGLLAERGLLGQTEIDLLWNLQQNNNDVQVRVVYQLVIQLSGKLSGDSLAYLYSKVKELPPEYEIREVEMIKGFAEKAAFQDGNDTFGFGLELLWQTIQDHAPVTQEVAEVASEALADIFSRVGTKNQLVELLEFCIENLQNKSSEAPTMRLMQLILDAQPERSHMSSVYSKDQIIDELERNCQILNLVIEDVNHYLETSKKAVFGRRLSADEAHITVLEGSSGRLTHAQALATRLDFLGFLLESSTLMLSFEQINTLWATSVREGGACESDKDAFLKWLWQIAPEEMLYNKRSAFKAMNENTARRVFLELLCSGSSGLDMFEIGESAYWCIEKFFRYVNAKQNRISNSHQKTYFTIEDFFRLEGLDTIWMTFVLCKNDKVKQAAEDFLIHLYLRLSPRMDRTLVWKDFVDRSMKFLRGAVEGSNDREYDLRVMNKIASLVIRLLEEADKLYGILNIGQPGRVEPELRVRVRCHKGTLNAPLMRELQYTFRKGAVTVGALRARISSDVHFPANQIRLCNSSRQRIQAHAHDKTLIDRVAVNFCDAVLLKAPDVDTNQFTPIPNARAADMNAKSERHYPRDYLCNNQDHFNLLFDLVQAGDQEVRDKAWHLIQLLPTNTQILDEITLLGTSTIEEEPSQLDEEAWNSLLPSTSPVTLLYRLNVAHKLSLAALNPHAMPGDRLDSERWGRRFAAAGGLPQLLRLLLSGDTDTMVENKLHKQCLATLLKTISLFLVSPDVAAHQDSDDDTSASDSSEEEEDPDAVIPPPEKPEKPEKPELQRHLSHEERDVVLKDLDKDTLIRRLLQYMHAVARSVNPVSEEERELMRTRKAKKFAQRQRYAAAKNSTSKAKTNDDSMDVDDGWTSSNQMGKQEEETQTNSPEAEAVRHALSLLVTLTLTSPEELEVIMNFPGLEALLLYSLLKTPEAGLRRTVAKGVQKLCVTLRGAVATGEQDPVRFFTTMMLRMLPEVAENNEFCDEYFGLVAELVTLRGAIEPEKCLELCTSLSQIIISAPVVEESEDDEDLVLRGHLLLLNAILDTTEMEVAQSIKLEIGASLIPVVFDQGLFALPAQQQPGDEDAKVGPQPPKCKNPQTRGMAFMVLSQLSKDCPANFDQLLHLVAPHHHIGRDPQERALMAKKDAKRTKASGVRRATTGRGMSYLYGKSKTGYVGLKNLGCICYMNSSMQQFFMIPEFRKALLAFEHTDEDLDESMMYQLQTMFAKLQDSEKSYYNPKGFCHAFKNWDGEPTDVLIQQDASEFLTMFFQHVEGQVMGSKSEDLLKHSFGGEFSNELIADGDKYSERPEPYYFISVPVKNMKCLEDALGSFIEGETVDYTWETPGEEGEEPKKESLPTVKRISIKRLPRHLVVHLKRFEFDFETMQQAKINDRFEFGHSLNMLPYTVEGREGSNPDLEKGPDDYYNYTLCGAVVHVGTANSGHYYSYIRERGTNNWFEFNDTFVGDFDIEYLEDECFGGEEESYMSNYSGQSTVQGQGVSIGTTNTNWLREKIRNAFMLVYDRNDVFEEEKGEVPSNGLKYKAPLPSAIKEEIYRENVEHWRKKNILDRRYFDFLSSFLRQHVEHGGDEAPGQEVFELAVQFVLGTLVQARESNLLMNWVDRLEELLDVVPEGCKWVMGTLGNDLFSLKELLLLDDDIDIRQNVGHFLGSVLVNVTPSSDSEFNEPFGRVVATFIESLLNLLPDAQIHWRRMDQFILLLANFAKTNLTARKYLLDQGCLGQILSFFLADESPFPELVTGGKPGETPLLPAMGDSYNKPNFLEVFQLLTLLLESSLIEYEADTREAETKDDKIYTISEAETKMIYSKSFAGKVMKAIRSPALKAAVTPLITRLATGSQLYSTLFEQECLSHIDEEDYLNLKPYFRGLMILLSIEDSMQEWRLNSILSKLLEVMKTQQTYIKATEASLDLLLRIVKGCPGAGPWLRQHRDECKWVEPWLQEKRSGKIFQPHVSGKTLYKPKRFATNTYQGGAISSTNLPKPTTAMAVHEVQAHYKSIFSGKGSEKLKDHYDSDDDPNVLIGRKIEVRWQHDKYYAGVIDNYDPDTGKHHVTYNDGDQRDYVIAEKNWKFIQSN